MAATRTSQRVTASAVSWMSLVAATTLGLGGVDQVRTRISARGHVQPEGELRLIVQSYRRGTLDERQLPAVYAEPLGSTQRAVTPEELAAGVDVNLVQLPREAADSDSIVVAWVENGSPTLDYDARQARPSQGAFYGVAQGTAGELVLERNRA